MMSPEARGLFIPRAWKAWQVLGLWGFGPLFSILKGKGTIRKRMNQGFIHTHGDIIVPWAHHPILVFPKHARTDKFSIGNHANIA